MDTLDMNHGNVPRWKGTEVGTVLQLQTCPYNPSHRVGHGSFAAHLKNCRKGLSEEKRARYVVCEYNATHHMIKEVYQDHLKICMDFRYYNADQFYLPPEFFGHPPAKSSDLEDRKRAKEQPAKEPAKDQNKDDKYDNLDPAERRLRDQRDRVRKAMKQAAQEDEYTGRPAVIDVDKDKEEHQL